MSLVDVLDAASARRKTLVVHGAGADEFAGHFESRNVDVVESGPPDGSAPFATVREDDEFRAALSLSDLRAYFEPPVEEPAEYPTAAHALYELLDDSVFESLSRRQLLATAREIEDRAYRTGRGTLHAGFQTRAAFEGELPKYRRLAAETDLGVHAYLVPGPATAQPLHEASLTVHETPHPDVGKFWFVVFDGGRTGQQCALVAEQRGRDAFRGVWTYDTDLVAAALDAVREVRERQSASGNGTS